jgi:hypothetical protein
MDQLYNKEKNNSCLLCLIEINPNEDVFNSTNIILKNNSEYYFGCSCKIVLHKTCMEEWCNARLCCPICLTVFKETTYSITKKFIKNGSKYVLYQFCFTICYVCVFICALSYYVYLMLTMK